MRGATLVPHVSEISFPIQKRVEFRRLGELDVVDPAGASASSFVSSGLPASASFASAVNFCAQAQDNATLQPKDSTNEQLGVELLNAFKTAVVANISANRGHSVPASVRATRC